MSIKDVVRVEDSCGHLRAIDESKEIRLLCCNLAGRSVKSQLVWCCSGVFFFFILYGYLQELIFSLEGFRPFGWYLTLIQFAYYTLFGWMESHFEGVSRRIPIKTYLFLALLTLGTMGFSNSSLGYLNYPTQVIFKCCKLIPVLIGGILVQGKKYGLLDFLAASLMCCGLILFTLADSMVSPRFNSIGVAMISSALLCDALIGNIQEKAMRLHKATNTEVVLYSYGIGLVYLFTILFFTGDLTKGAVFCAKHPIETYGYGLVFSLCGYIGIRIVLTLVQSCGAFVAATYLWSGLLVVLGIYLNIYSKQHGVDKNSVRSLWNSVKKCWRRQNQLQRRLMTNV